MLQRLTSPFIWPATAAIPDSIHSGQSVAIAQLGTSFPSKLNLGSCFTIRLPLISNTHTVECSRVTIFPFLWLIETDLTAGDLEQPGVQLLLTEDGKGYPVTLIANPVRSKGKGPASIQQDGPPSKRRAIAESDWENTSQVTSDSEVCCLLHVLL